jgi:diguanylate cyclase (GGDEF)-like protein
MDNIARKNRKNVVYLSALLAAGIAVFGWTLVSSPIETTNVPVFVTFVLYGLLCLFCLKYRRSVGHSKAEQKRADKAEWDFQELRHYLAEVEKGGDALRDSYEKFRHTAYHDGLTDLPNRKYIIEKLQKLLDDSAATNFSVLFLNLNRFRMINESLGHGTGDRVIRQVAKRICESIGESDVAGHFGGDDFAIILRETVTAEAAGMIAETISKRIAEAIRFKDREVYTGVSIGIVLGCCTYKRAENILRDADIAMYTAKDDRKKWVIFDPAMYARVVERQQIETDLRYAIVCNELEMFYQPIVRLDDASLFGFEALVRWNHPHRGLLSPADFIPVAESTGMIMPMTVQILKDACAKLAEWQEQFSPRNALMLSVNLSVLHLTDASLVEQIEELLRETGIRPSSLKLEITESSVMANAELAIETLKRIKETGVSISIDDFGTGYSSLSYLHRFPVDYLKIDRSFVNAMDESNGNREIVETIIALAKALKLSVIAEGIETKQQYQKLRWLGCELGQGYLFSRPLPVGEIEQFLLDPAPWSHLLPAGHIPGKYPGGTQIHPGTH